MNKTLRIEILAVVAIILVLSAVIVPALIRKSELHPTKDGRFLPVYTQEMEDGAYVTTYEDRHNGNEITCFQGRLASSPSCFISEVHKFTPNW